MENLRFDDLAIRLTTLLTRRGFGRALVALGIGAGVASGQDAASGNKKKKKKCKNGKKRCGKACVAIKTNASHCGGCNRPCGAGTDCRNGICAEPCESPNTDCRGVCVNLQTDNAHCGGCGIDCGDGECQGGECQPPPSTCGSGGECRVFATSLTYTGNLGGLTGADQKCNTRALAAGLPGVYMAWLSDSTGSPSSRFAQSSGPYVLVDGTQIADNWTSLTDTDVPTYALDHEINQDEFGNEITTGATSRFTWTNTKPGGTLNIETHHCQNWSTNDGTPNFGSAGNVNAPDSFWTYATSIFCNNPGQRLYCFQQS